ncbi:MAG: MYXO-CTERM sorting domain-containing protein [bacterium]
MTEVKLPSGPNLKTPSPTTTEPYQVVFPKRLSWSPDGGVAHYQLLFQNRKGTPKEGWTVIGYFVDVSTGKTVATYNWEKKGFMCPSLAPLWKKGRSREWAEKFLKDHAFAPLDNKKSKRTWHPDRKAGITLTLTAKKTKVGWISSFRAATYFRWEWSTYKRQTTAEDKLDARLELQMKRKGVKGVTVLRTHQPYLDYHYSLTHEHTWKQAVEREEGGNATVCQPGQGVDNAECRRARRKHGLIRRDRYPFTGEVWVYWSPQADALLAFWDDRQVRGVDTPNAHGVYRSYVTVHAIAPRQPSPLIAKLASAPATATAPAMATATKADMAVMGASAMAAGASKSAAMADSGKGAQGEMGGGDSKQATAGKKKGCGCRQGPAAAFPGLLLMALAFVGLYRRRRRRSC